MDGRRLTEAGDARLGEAHHDTTGVGIRSVSADETFIDQPGYATAHVATKAATLGKTPEQVYADFAAETALGRFVEEGDIADAIDFLLSPGAKNITGHDIVVDAGWDV